MSMDYNAASSPIMDPGSDTGFPAPSISVRAISTQHFPLTPLTGEESSLLCRLIDASSHIPGLTFVSPENLDVLEHLGRHRDLVISGPDRLITMTCAALPVIAGCGLTVVVAPSIDHLKRLRRRFEDLNITTACFEFAPTKIEKQNIWEQLDQDQIQILLVSPGRLASHRFRERLRRRTIANVIVDQGHLMSPWSHKFIPSYRFVGSFLATLANEHSQPRKIVLNWNAPARVFHDLSKLMGLNDPYQGSLAPEAVPGLGIESVTKPTDSERVKMIVGELKRSGGQGVIYCNSINQVFETTKILEASNEDFALYRPGFDESILATIKQQFEQGEIRLVVAIGPFLSELETARGLEFVIFNGMPESADTMGRELLFVQDAGFIRTIVIAGDKDYFQHRFSIDKNYPDALALRACVQSIRDVFGSKNQVSRETLSTHLKMATPFPDEDVEQCLQVMFREGLLETIIDQVSGAKLVGFPVSMDDEANFWHEYPLRKIDHIARLDKMREFVAKEGDRARQLYSLIRQ